MRESFDVKIVVASHKPYWMPPDPMYIPMQVGALGKDPIANFSRDDQGWNISEKNPRYCELTALYWAWKNLDADFVGLAHYRRHFAGGGERGVLTNDEANGLIKQAPVIVPKRRHYYIESVGSHYAHTFDGEHLKIVRDSLELLSPDMVPFYDDHLNERSSHIWNMLIMRRDMLDRWCSWLFPVLEEIEARMNFADMTPFEERAIGRLSERLLDPWIASNSVDIVELPVTSLEPVNWPKKIGGFLGAKFMGHKYAESF